MSEYLLTSTAARILDKAPATVHWYERVGKLRAMRIDGGTRLFRRSDVERLALELAAQKESQKSK